MNTTFSNNGNNADFADFGIEGDEEKPFPVKCLPPDAQNYLREICRVDGVGEALPGACMLGTLSMALGSGGELYNGRHRVRGNLFVLGAARSGTGKSVVFNRVVQPFLDCEKSLVKNWRENVLPGLKAKIRMLKQRQDTLHKQASKHPQTSEAGLQELTDIERQLTELERGLQEPCLVFGEATREKIVQLVSLSHRETLASASAEARGCINALMGRYNAKTDEDVFVALWTGDYYKLSRIQRPDTVLHNPCLSLLWLVQPDLLDQLLSIDGMSESGLLARTLLFEVSSIPQEIRTDIPINQSAVHGWQELVTWLASASYFRPTPYMFSCPPEVVALMATFNTSLLERRTPGGDLADVDIFAARWVEQTWRIMLVLHAAKQHGQPNAIVSTDTAREAIQLMDWFATQQLLLLTSRREKKRDERFEVLVDVLRRKPDQSCSLRDMRRRHHFQEAEVRKIVQDHPDILVIKDLKPQGPGRPSQGVAML
jgi:hypothetical protein